MKQSVVDAMEDIRAAITFAESKGDKLPDFLTEAKEEIDAALVGHYAAQEMQLTVMGG